MSRILVTVCNQGRIKKHVVLALLKLKVDPRHEVTIMLPQHTPYENGLNRVVKEFLERDFDYWLNMDSDNPPMEGSDPLSLVEMDYDIVGFPTPVIFYLEDKPGEAPYYFNAMDYKEDEKNGWGWEPTKPCAGIKEVDAVGSGCILVSRRVLEKMKKPLFMREWNEEGIVERGHDYIFCKNAKEQGFKVWAHFDHPCRHFVEVDALTYTEALLNSVSPKNG